MAEDVATRGVALALAEERGVMRQGYAFLDEKRVLLAAEILRRLRAYEAREAAFLERLRAARARMAAAVARHGLEILQLYPPQEPPPAPPERGRAQFLGVPLTTLSFAPAPGRPAHPALDPSAEAEACREAFLDLLAPIAELAAEAGAVARLGAEYRRTEKRARALENVLLPEIEQRLKAVRERLETADQEEAVRAHIAKDRP